jgi:DNA topoisomerase-6 subunit B
MPAAPEETKFHPSAVDLLLIKRLIADITKVQLLQFLEHEFVVQQGFGKKTYW